MSRREGSDQNKNYGVGDKRALPRHSERLKEKRQRVGNVDDGQLLLESEAGSAALTLAAAPPPSAAVAPVALSALARNTSTDGSVLSELVSSPSFSAALSAAAPGVFSAQRNALVSRSAADSAVPSAASSVSGAVAACAASAAPRVDLSAFRGVAYSRSAVVGSPYHSSEITGYVQSTVAISSCGAAPSIVTDRFRPAPSFFAVPSLAKFQEALLRCALNTTSALFETIPGRELTSIMTAEKVLVNKGNVEATVKVEVEFADGGVRAVAKNETKPLVLASSVLAESLVGTLFHSSARLAQAATLNEAEMTGAQAGSAFR